MAEANVKADRDDLRGREKFKTKTSEVCAVGEQAEFRAGLLWVQMRPLALPYTGPPWTFGFLYFV